MHINMTRIFLACTIQCSSRQLIYFVVGENTEFRIRMLSWLQSYHRHYIFGLVKK